MVLLNRPGRVFIALSLLLCAAGCQGGPRTKAYIDNLNAEKRVLEDQLYDLQYELESMEYEVDRYREENEQLRRDLQSGGGHPGGSSSSSHGGSSGPHFGPTRRDGGGGSGSTRGGAPELKPPEIEIGDPDEPEMPRPPRPSRSAAPDAPPPTSPEMAPNDAPSDKDDASASPAPRLKSPSPDSPKAKPLPPPADTEKPNADDPPAEKPGAQNPGAPNPGAKPAGAGGMLQPPPALQPPGDEKPVGGPNLRRINGDSDSQFETAPAATRSRADRNSPPLAPPLGARLLPLDAPMNGAGLERDADDGVLDGALEGDPEVQRAGAVEPSGPPHSLSLDPQLTGGAQFDELSGDDGVTVAFTLRDAQGRPVVRPGVISLVLLDSNKQGAAARVARWDLDAAQTARLFRGQPVEKITLHMAWPAAAPTTDRLKLYMRYQADGGPRLEAYREITLNSPTPVPAVIQQTGGWRRAAK